MSVFNSLKNWLLIVDKRLAKKEVCGNTLDVNEKQVLVSNSSHIHSNIILVAFLGILLLNIPHPHHHQV
jgi:hypothetical protein